jgi:hypothetical protein
MKRAHRFLAALLVFSFFLLSMPSSAYTQPPAVDAQADVDSSPPTVYMSPEQKVSKSKVWWYVAGIVLVGGAIGLAMSGGGGGDGDDPTDDTSDTGNLTVAWE